MISAPSFVTYQLLLFFLISSATGAKDPDNNEDSAKILYPNDFTEISQPYPRFHQHHHHHHNHQDFPPNFQHSPEFHRGDPKYSHSVEETPDGYDDIEYFNDTFKYIPLEFINIVNQNNITDLLLNYIEDDSEEYPMLANRFGDNSERSESAQGLASIPKPAGCSPEVETIKLKNSSDPSILYIPQCTKVERCSGCCSHPLLSCQPNSTETLTYQVLKTQYNGAKKLKLLGKEIILVEKHLSCKCDCKIKEESCNKYQEYHQSECRCVCTNTDEEKKCYRNHTKKLWNPDLCACQCRDVFECSTGQYFDNHECKCIVAPMRRRYATISPEDLPPVNDESI